MFTNIERIEAGTGLIGTLTINGRRLSIALLLSDARDPNDAGAQNEALSLQINSHRRRHIAAVPASKARISPARHTFEQPLLLKPATGGTALDGANLDEQLMDLLDNPASSCIIVQSEDPDTYAYLSERLGVSRADHIAVAGMPSLGTEQAHKKRPVPSGKAHLLLEDMASTRALDPRHRHFELFCGDSDAAHLHMIRLSEHIEARLPHAMKINLGDMSKKNRTTASPEASSPVFQNFRLPYRECLFEFEDLATWKGKEYKTRSFIFAETLDLPDGQTIYQAYLLQYHPTPGTRMAQMYDYALSWKYDADGNCEPTAVLTYGKDPYTSKELAIQNCLGMHDTIFPVIAAINRPTTKMIEVPASQTRRMEIGNKPKAPFFDFYVFEESTLPAGTIMDQGYQSARGPLTDARKSPRGHDRRGYERTYKSSRWGALQGTTVWINPTTVGKPRDGVKARALKADPS